MGRRLKALKQRLYHYYPLQKRSDRPLYGGVYVQRYQLFSEPSLSIQYLSKRGAQVAFPIAKVYLAADDATLYEVYGIGKKRNHDHAMRQKVARWKRYSPAFTPLPEGERLYEGERRYYLLRKDGTTALLAEKPGVWRGGKSTLTRQAIAEWLRAGDGLLAYPLFTKRARRFVRRLVAELVGIQCGIMLWHVSSIPNTSKGYRLGVHLSFTVSTPPTSTRDGRTLGVEIYMYDREAREHHHVDGDYGMKHCHFLACQHPEPGAYRSRHPLLRWKCAADAIVGIKEWIIGDIYIPGPG